MKFFTRCLAFAICLFVGNAKAQILTQGDVTVMLLPMTNHDSTVCATTGQMMFQITINNSFVGDAVYVVDSDGQMLIFEEVNTTGQNPWMVMAPIFTASGFIPDNQLVSGYANFGGMNTKVISGTDTVYNINTFYSEFVTNPCTYEWVTGLVYIDNNADCEYNAGDATLNMAAVNGHATLNSPSQSEYGTQAFTTTGTYNMQLQQSWMTEYTVSVPSYFQFIFPLTACSPQSYTFTSLPQDSVDFSLQCSSNLDVQCYAGSPGAARPNVPFFMSPSVSNTGCNPASGQLKLVLDPNVTYDASLSTYPADAINGDTLVWNYANLSNLTGGMYWNSFVSSIHLTPTLAVNVGDSLCFHVFTDVPAGDANQWNNDYAFCIPVVNSYDPNMKEVTPQGTGVEGFIPSNTPELTYTIHFQNTGTAPAFNVNIVDTLDADLQANSLRIVGASHSFMPEWLSANVVRFNFYNINLPDSNANEAASHGFVTFKINPTVNLPIGTQIKNTGYIYFDFNTAVVTNTALNTIAEANAIETNKTKNALVDVYPNPANSHVTVNNLNTNEYEIRVENCLGQLVHSTSAKQAQHVLDLSSLQKGVYVIRVIDIASKASAVRKIVLQ